MKEKVDISVVLRAIACIQSKGKTRGNGFSYRGIELESDYDGYTVVLRNADVSLTVLFHNKFDLNFRNRPALDDFYDTIKKISTEPRSSEDK